MATAHLRGTARFTYTHPDNGATTHLLALPLSPVRDIKPSNVRKRFAWMALDGKTRAVVTVGEGVKEIEAVIRMDNEPVELTEMLRVALEEDVTLTYEHVTGGDSFPVMVMSADGSGDDRITLTPDRDRYGGGEWEIRIVIRRVDGGTLDGVFS